MLDKATVQKLPTRMKKLAGISYFHWNFSPRKTIERNAPTITAVAAFAFKSVRSANGKATNIKRDKFLKFTYEHELYFQPLGTINQAATYMRESVSMMILSDHSNLHLHQIGSASLEQTQLEQCKSLQNPLEELIGVRKTSFLFDEMN